MLWLQQQTAQMSGYMSTNAALIQGPPDTFQCYQDAANALANLAMATSNDHKPFKNLSNTIAHLMRPVKDEDAEIVAPKKCINKCSNCNHKNNKHNQGTYCWMHGYLVQADHSSEYCCNPAPGH